MSRSHPMPSIVVLDDDPIVLELLRMVLEDAGYASICGARLEDVPAAVRPDLVISDLIPLKAYGRLVALDWISTLRERFGPVPILVVTAHTAALREPDGLGVPWEVAHHREHRRSLLAPHHADAGVGPHPELPG